MDSELVSKQMECDRRNFPVMCLYEPESNSVFSFYRQGEMFKTECSDISKYQFYKVYDGDIG